MTTQTINQEQRREIARRILAGDTTAIAELANLYRAAGYRILADAIGRYPEQTVEHARTFLEAS